MKDYINLPKLSKALEKAKFAERIKLIDTACDILSSSNLLTSIEQMCWNPLDPIVLHLVEQRLAHLETLCQTLQNAIDKRQRLFPGE